MINKKIFFLPAVVILLLPAYAHAQERLTVWSFTDEVGNLVSGYFQPTHEELNIDYIYIPTEQFEAKLDPLLAGERPARRASDIVNTPPGARRLPDVISLEAMFLRKYVESGYLLDLTGIYKANKDKLLSYPVQAATYNGRVYALSWQACTGAMYYRRSLARKYLGTDDPVEVQRYFNDIKSFMETAMALKERSGGECVVVSSYGDLAIPFTFARAQPWVVDGGLVIDPAMEQYMDIVKAIRENRLDGGVGMWSEGWFGGMSDELRDYDGNRLEVFSYFMPTWGLHYVLKPNAKRTESDWAMIQGPVPYYWGGTWLAAIKGSENPQAAKELIRYLTTDDAFLERYAFDTGDIVSNIKVLNRIKNQFSEPFLGGQNHYAAFTEMSFYVTGSLKQSTDRTIEDYFNEAVSYYIFGEKSKEQALSDFSAQVKSHLKINN
jgi:ABC-type glycerol-3-phosphate transport system substrate-binding protein